MFGINQPVNEWFTGEYYEYNLDQDQTTKKVKDLIKDDSFVKDEDFDDNGYSLYQIEFRYKQFVDTNNIANPITGLRSNKLNATIETNTEYIEFKLKDKIKLINKDSPLKITDISINKQTSKAMNTLILPGLYDEYNANRKVITLQ